VALHQKPSLDAGEVVDKLRGILHATLAGASNRAGSAGRTIGLAAYFVGLRSRLKGVLMTIQGASSIEDHGEVMRDAELLYLRRRDEFHAVENRTDLIRAWNNLLIEAAEKRARDDRDAELFAADARAMDDEDREWYDAMCHHAAGEH
jgi:hypothetical protein